MTEERLSLNTKDRINDLATAFVANGNMRAYKNNNEECINKFKDIYALHAHKDNLAKLPGLGQKSVEKLLESIEKYESIQDGFIDSLERYNELYLDEELPLEKEKEKG